MAKKIKPNITIEEISQMTSFQMKVLAALMLSEVFKNKQIPDAKIHNSIKQFFTDV